jgi:hypothetical protein
MTPTRPAARLAFLSILAALLLALAVPGTAPATPASACAKAGKQLRTAKAGLRKAQKRRAVKTALAKARKRVKRAEAAKRRACRTPAGPPSPPPAPRPSAAAPPVKPAGGGSPGAPDPGPQRDAPADPPPDPPKPQPTLPTSGELIDKALAEGRIDAETALRYEVFAEFGDDRLPAEFRGAPPATPHADAVERVIEQWDELSAETRATLDPFFVPPFNPGSWYHAEPAGDRAASRAAARADLPEPPGKELCRRTAPDFKGWGYVTAADFKLRIWYESAVPGQQAKAIAISEHLDSGAYARVTGALRTPLPDGGDLAGRRCRGLDPSIDVALTPLGDALGRTFPHPPEPDDCRTPASGHVVIRRSLTGDALMATVAHELAHLAQFAYTADACSDDITWLREATASWMEDHAGDYGPDFPEELAPNLLDEPNRPLERVEDDKTPRQYGAYLFFQWLARTKSPAIVGDVWEAAQAPGDLLAQIDDVLAQHGFAGGFTEAWKGFALAGLNPREKADWFKQWGYDGGALVSAQGMQPDDEETIDVEIPHLSAQYDVISFDDGVKGIAVTNALAHRPGASLQAWVLIEEGGEQRVEVHDWSNRDRPTLCERPGENVLEIALVAGNSTHADRNHWFHDDPVVRTTSSCGGYTATTKITHTYGGLTEVYTATHELGFMWQIPLEGGGRQTYFETADDDSAGHGTWALSGSMNGCTISGSALLPQAGHEPPDAWLQLNDFGKDDPRTEYEWSFDTGNGVATTSSVCPEGPSTSTRQIGVSHATGPITFDPEDQTITGSNRQTFPGPIPESVEREWTLKPTVEP